MVRRGSARRCLARRGTAWARAVIRGTAWRRFGGMFWHGVAVLAAAGLGMARAWSGGGESFRRRLKWHVLVGMVSLADKEAGLLT